ncbi:hypothetical protein ACU4GI_43445, partial [Cupriavidus basilensis]
MHRQLIDFQVAGNIVLQDQRQVGGPFLCAGIRVLAHFMERTGPYGGNGSSKHKAAGHEKIERFKVHFLARAKVMRLHVRGCHSAQARARRLYSLKYACPASVLLGH